MLPELEKRRPPSTRSEYDDKKGDVTVDEFPAEPSGGGDEALKLVGKERQAEFSSEYNVQLRKKLVSIKVSIKHTGVDRGTCRIGGSLLSVLLCILRSFCML